MQECKNAIFNNQMTMEDPAVEQKKLYCPLKRIMKYVKFRNNISSPRQNYSFDESSGAWIA
jgi:hypothetical protein